MSRVVIKSKQIVCDEKKTIVDGFVSIENGTIVDVSKKGIWQEGSYEFIDCSLYKVFPGLIDVHIHGALGKDFVEGKQEVVDAVSYDVIKDGVTAYVASLTVVSHKRMLEILRGFDKVEAPREGARFLGIHAEGPYISKKFKALMNELYIREPNIKEVEEMIESANGKLVLMTYSPHYETATSLLKYARVNNIKMMIGHSEASCQQSVDALENGASGYTHFYNAMSGHHHREEGVVTSAFVSNLGYAELIADKIHVSPTVLKFTYNLLGSNRLILITDAMPGKSMADGTFFFSELESIKKNGKAYVKETGRLAGSVIGLNEALLNMASICGCNDNQLVEMACVNPAKLLEKENIGTIAEGKKGDLAIFDDKYQCMMTIIDGKVVYQAGN